MLGPTAEENCPAAGQYRHTFPLRTRDKKTMMRAFAFLLIAVHIGAAPVFADEVGTHVNGYTVHFVYNNKLFILSLSGLPYRSVVQYGYYETCPDAHKTKQGRTYEHLHLNFTLPQYAFVDGDWVLVTEGMVGQFWDIEYDGYEGIPASPDFSQNCHGYAFESGTFMAPDVYGLYLWNGDYVWITAAGTPGEKCAESSSEHAIRSMYELRTVTTSSGTTPETLRISTSEKFLESGVYRLSMSIDSAANVSLKSSCFGPYFSSNGTNGGQTTATRLPGYTTYVNCRQCHPSWSP